MAGRICRNERVAKCGQRLNGPQAIVCIGDAGAYVAGVVTCGSVWMCPVCAAKIAEGRRRDVAECLTAHVWNGLYSDIETRDVRGGGDVFMSLMTMPHHARESCAEVKGDVRECWRRMIAGRAWKEARERYGIEGYIRALETTHGANGWHPHIHALFLTRALSEVEEAEFRIWLGERWAAVVERVTGKAVNLAKGFGFERALSISAAGDYVAKWGVDSEISKAAHKVSRKGGRSPWQLLADARDGDHRARMLFAEYATAFKGTRHLTWSVGLRDLYLETPELDDIQLAKQDAPFQGDQQVMVFRRAVWFNIVRAGVIPDVLEAAEAGGRAGILKYLRSVGLALPDDAFVHR